MATGEAEIVIRRSAREIIDFVMDLREYRKVDEKLGTIHWVRDGGDGGVLVRFTPKVLGLPGPPTTQRVRPDGNRIDIRGEPAWTDVFVTFRASFTCEEGVEGTTVHRRLEFAFRPPVSWLLDPIFDRWLRTAVPDELAAAKAHLEAGPRRP